MKVELSKIFHFEAAHFLPRVPPEHKCRQLHGHSYGVEIVLSGEVDEEMGWLVDFADLREAWMSLRSQLDHKLLNEVEGLENPTSENIARWVYDRMKAIMPLTHTIVLHETANSKVVYRGE